MIRLSSCPKKHRVELDKATSPAETVARVREKLQHLPLDILATTKRIDVGRLNIPVYVSLCGSDARKIMPTRKQMGKGASPQQAEASALMELMERYAFFTFWERLPHLPQVVKATWSEAEARFGSALIPVEELLLSVNDSLSPTAARELLDCVRWQFLPLTCLNTMQDLWVPLNWFKKLGEFNGTSAGNTEEESLLQGVCEIIERHACCLIDREQRVVPTIDPASIDNAILQNLLTAFAKQGVQLILKDFSCQMPVPTVAALAWDPATFPAQSEIVYTAGTASSPIKAAIRAVTEVAQLAGDFCTSACYEASGLQKFQTLDQASWLLQGPLVSIDTLPSVESADILEELTALVQHLAAQDRRVYALSTMHPDVQVNTHYCIIPGTAFRERDINQSLGLFIGRILTEEGTADEINTGMKLLEKYYPKGHFIPFFQGMLALRSEDLPLAQHFFTLAETLQPEADSQALTAFYVAYTATLMGDWQAALPPLDRAVQLCPDMKEYWNLRGVAHFKTQNYVAAAHNFECVLKIDKGSVMDIANLGLCHKFMNQPEKARVYLQTALELDPNLEFAKSHLQELA
ncbi:MAG: YcaO-like family protein [Desulfovibrionaceae bacterium]